MCIKIIPISGSLSNNGNAITILRNDEVVDTTPAYGGFSNAHETCFESFDIKNDIFELRNGGADAVKISVILTRGGMTTQLMFGLNEDLTEIWINGNLMNCGGGYETTPSIKIQNGIIVRSACKGEFLNYEIQKMFEFLFW